MYCTILLWDNFPIMEAAFPFEYPFNLSKIVAIFSPICFVFFRITKMFAANKEDRKRVEKALDLTGLPSGKVSAESDVVFPLFSSLPKFWNHLILTNACDIEMCDFITLRARKYQVPTYFKAYS